MYKIFTFVVLFLLFCFAAKAQSLQPSVIGTLGGYSAPSGGPTLSYSMGETFIATLQSGGYTLTQGFEQTFNNGPVFTGGASPSLIVCENATASSINTLLKVFDVDSGQTENWSALVGPAHGTLVASYTTISNGDTLTPLGLSYTPATGYSGADSFSIVVSDGQMTDTLTVSVTVTPFPVAGTISGTSNLCPGTTTTFTDTPAGGIWTSSNAGVATISTSGVVSAVAYGNDTISYSVSNSCGSTISIIPIVVLPNSVGAIVGDTNVCVGSTTTLGDPVPGGTWGSSTHSIATISASGIVTGVASGTSTIVYVISNICTTDIAYFTIRSISLPYAGFISGPSSLCVSSSVALTDTTTGGTWSSSNTAIATVSTAGVITGVSAGSVTISYTLSNTCGSTSATKTMTINPLPDGGSISGTTTVCPGSTTSLSDAATGGSWSSSNTSIASVNSSGVVSGMTTGSATISYSVTNTCGTSVATAGVTVNISGTPAAISGASSLCIGAATTLSDSVTGGSWGSSDNSVATVNSSGVVTGVSAGTVTIIYYISNSCGSGFVVKNLTVNTSAVAAITGASSVCMGSTTTLADATASGTWSSSNSSIASVSTSGVVIGVSPGSVTISYSVTNSCGTNSAIISFVVNTATIADITGPSTVCSGSTITLSDTTIGGMWTSSDTTIAAINSTGEVSGINTGTVTIIYSVTNSCGTLLKFATITVQPLPSVASVSGPATLCVGATTALTDASAGGIWVSSDTTVATINSAGLLTAVATGTDTVTYTITTSCGTAAALIVITVNRMPDAGTITGSSSVCTGASATFTDTTSGGSWSTSNASIASVDASGIVNGIASGSATISYITTGLCNSDTATHSVSVLPLTHAGTITGVASVCAGSSSGFSASGSGGTWSSSDASIASVDVSGTVSGIASGSATISYITTGSCNSDTATYSVSVLPLSDAGSITGIASLCEGSSTGFTTSGSSGAWSTSNASVASVDVSGTVSGIASGSATISYITTGSCNSDTATYSVSVLPLSDAGTITGVASLCDGSSTGFTSSGSSGTWSTSNASVASVDVSGTVSGVGSGSATISYIATGSCNSDTATYAVTILPLPLAGTLSSAGTVCPGASTLVSATVTGGVWTSSNVSRATISSSGLVTGVSTGAVTISYAITNSCGTSITTTNITVNPAPAAGTLSGATTVCSGATTTLGSSVTGGSWSSSNTSVATISSGGIVTGVAPGTDTIIYTVTNSCGSASAMRTITVNPLPAVGTITGSSLVCVAANTTLSNTVSGGTWSSGTTSVATVNSSGVVRGVTAGIVTISYSVTNSCGTATATKVLNIGAFAGTVTGASNICTGSTASYSASGATGGTWSSTATSVATITSGGVATGVSGGSSSIRYTVTNSCGTAVASATLVVSVPGAIASIVGSNAACPGVTITMTNSTTGGTWSSTNTSLATVSATGVVTTLSPGTDTIVYTVTNACGTVSAIKPITITGPTYPAAIAGSTAAICVGATMTYTDGTTGGVWSISNPLIATVNSSGVVTGVAAGTDTVLYTITNSCGLTGSALRTITINASAAAGTITGPSNICTGSTVTYTTTGASGGAWSSSNTSAATVSSTGVVTPVSASATTIRYTVTSACGTDVASLYVTVSAPGAPAAISGPLNLCVGSSATFTDATAGGSWSSSASSIATINSSGVATGVANGTATITYTITNACGTYFSVRNLAVNATVPVVTISGPSTVAIGGSPITLTHTGPTGVWSSVSPSLATISTGGVVTGVAAGADTIKYTATNGCGAGVATKVITITEHREEGGTTGHAEPLIGLYPNPTTGVVMIKLQGTIGDAAISVTDISGKTVLTASSPNSMVEINLGNVASGVYLVTVSTENSVYKGKVIVQ